LKRGLLDCTSPFETRPMRLSSLFEKRPIRLHITLWNETNEIEIGERDWINIQMQRLYKHVRGSDTEWRRPLGYLKLQVIFRARATNYRALLRKMTYKDKAPYDSTPPCIGDIRDKSVCFCKRTLCFRNISIIKPYISAKEPNISAKEPVNVDCIGCLSTRP